jgi:hypothetical protein
MVRAQMRGADKSVSYGTKPRQNLEFEEKRVIAVNTRIHPVEMERVGTSRVCDTLTKEDRFVPGAFQMLC